MQISTDSFKTGGGGGGEGIELQFIPAGADVLLFSLILVSTQS